MACRLCLYIFEDDFSHVEKTDQTLSPEYVLAINTIPELDLELSTNPLICNTCIETLKTYSEFKTMCRSTEDILQAYGSSKLQTTLDIVDAYKYLRRIHQNVELRVCRICFTKCSSGKAFFPSSHFYKFFQSCVDKSLAPTSGCVICENCIEKIEELDDFKYMCLNTQNLIIQYKTVSSKKSVSNKDLLSVAKVKGVKKLTTLKETDCSEQALFQTTDCKIEIEENCLEDKLLLKYSEVKMQTEEELVIKKKTPNEKLYKCHCGYEAIGLKIYKAHVGKFHRKKVMKRKLPCEGCRMTSEGTCFTLHKLYDIRKSEDADLYKCMTCGCLTSYMKNLRCKFCRRYFKEGKSLKKHILMKHRKVVNDK